MAEGSPENPDFLVAFTLIENSKGYATKKFELSPGGALTAMPAGQIWEGRARRVSVPGLQSFMQFRAGLKSNQALAFGITDVLDARLVAKKQLSPGTIARDADHFSYAEGRPGMLMLDYDPRNRANALTAQQFDAAISEAMPEWACAERAIAPSSSAFIYRSAGEELIGQGGLRAYAIASDASAIPEVGALIYQALWARGHGYVHISASGALLGRTLVDACVWQPERLDFAAPPVLGQGLERKLPAPLLLAGAPMLNVTGLRAEPMAEWRRTSPLLKAAREGASDEARRVRAAFIKNKVKAAGGRDARQAKRLWTEAVQNRALMADFELVAADGPRVAVREMLADPERYHGARFADPVEPDYRCDRRIAYANLEAPRPFIYSHAHGGMRYELCRETADIVLRAGERSRAIDETLVIVRGRGNFYERGGELIRVLGQELIAVSDRYLADYLGRHIRFLRMVKQKEERVDAPLTLCQQILAKRGERGLLELREVITAPTLRPGGAVLRTPGYDPETKLLLIGDKFPPVPDRPAMAQLRAAHAALWAPFAEFPFEAPSDRGAMLAALLTAMVRHLFPTAPAFSFDAPAAGSGKTLLASCIQILCGMTPAAIPECRDDEELRKRLTAARREGKPSILLDNIRGAFGSAALEAFLTDEEFSDRKLGASEMITYSTRVTLLISGNNFQPKGDLFRRIISCRIDAKTDAPENRSFRIRPAANCRRNRLEMVAAGLTLLRGFLAAGAPRDQSAAGSVGSFEDWDNLIRQCVLWLARQGIADAADPAECMRRAKEQEPERQKLASFLRAVWDAYRDERWRTQELISRSLLYPELREVLDEIAGERGVINPRRLGRWIEAQREVHCGGLHLSRAGERNGVALWRAMSGAAFNGVEADAATNAEHYH